MVQGRSQRADRRVPGGGAARGRDGRAVRRRRVRLSLRRPARTQSPRDEKPDRDCDRRSTGQLRGLYLRRRARLWPLQDQVHDVAREREGGARFCRHRSAIVGLDQLPAQREHDADVLRHLHDHGVRPANPVQRWLLRPDRRAHPRRIAAQAQVPCGAVGPHPCAGPAVRHPGRTAGPEDARVPVRGGLLVLAALVLLGHRCRRRMVPAVPDRLRRHSRPSTGRWTRRALVVAQLHQRAQRVPRTLLPAADRAL